VPNARRRTFFLTVVERAFAFSLRNPFHLQRTLFCYITEFRIFNFHEVFFTFINIDNSL
jgi:hypothetical protein